MTSWLIWRSRRWRRSSSCSMGLSSGNSYGAVRISLSASERQNSSCPDQPCHELWPVSARAAGTGNGCRAADLSPASVSPPGRYLWVPPGTHHPHHPTPPWTWMRGDRNQAPLVKLGPPVRAGVAPVSPRAWRAVTPGCPVPCAQLSWEGGGEGGFGVVGVRGGEGEGWRRDPPAHNPPRRRTGPTSAISLYLPSMEVRRSTGKCFRQWGGPGRERADCRGRDPSPPRSSATPRQPQLGGPEPPPGQGRVNQGWHQCHPGHGRCTVAPRVSCAPPTANSTPSPAPAGCHLAQPVPQSPGVTNPHEHPLPRNHGAS